jgi:stage V sporulation protein G
MEITDIKIRKRTDDGKMKAIVSITLDQSLAVHDIKVIKGKTSCSWPCPAGRCPTGSTATSSTPSTRKCGGDRHQIIERYLQEAGEEEAADEGAKGGGVNSGEPSSMARKSERTGF